MSSLFLSSTKGKSSTSLPDIPALYQHISEIDLSDLPIFAESARLKYLGLSGALTASQSRNDSTILTRKRSREFASSNSTTFGSGADPYELYLIAVLEYLDKKLEKFPGFYFKELCNIDDRILHAPLGTLDLYLSDRISTAIISRGNLDAWMDEAISSIPGKSLKAIAKDLITNLIEWQKKDKSAIPSMFFTQYFIQNLCSRNPELAHQTFLDLYINSKYSTTFGSDRAVYGTLSWLFALSLGPETLINCIDGWIKYFLDFLSLKSRRTYEQEAYASVAIDILGLCIDCLSCQDSIELLNKTPTLFISLYTAMIQSLPGNKSKFRSNDVWIKLDGILQKYLSLVKNCHSQTFNTLLVRYLLLSVGEKKHLDRSYQKETDVGLFLNCLKVCPHSYRIWEGALEDNVYATKNLLEHLAVTGNFQGPHSKYQQFINNTISTYERLLAPKGWIGSLAEKSGFTKSDIEETLKMAKKMNKKLNRRSWKRLFLQLLLVSVLFVILFGYLQCSGYKPIDINKKGSSNGGKTSAGGAKSKTTASAEQGPWKSVTYVKNAVCPVYQQLHSTEAYKAVDASLRATVRQLLKQPTVVEARISWQKFTRNVRNSRAYQSVKTNIASVYEASEPVVLEAWNSIKKIGYNGLHILVRDVIPLVTEKSRIACEALTESKPVKDTLATAQVYYKERLLPIYAESVEPLVQKVLIDTGAASVIGSAVSRTHSAVSLAAGNVLDFFEDELATLQAFYTQLSQN